MVILADVSSECWGEFLAGIAHLLSHFSIWLDVAYFIVLVIEDNMTS